MPDTRKTFPNGVKVPNFTAGGGRLNDDKQTKFPPYRCHVTVEKVDAVKGGRKIREFHVSFYDADEARRGQTFWRYDQATNRYVVAAGAWGVCAGVASGPFLTKAWNTAKNRCKFGGPVIDNPGPAAAAAVVAAVLPAAGGAPALAAGPGPVVFLPVAAVPAVVAAPAADADAAAGDGALG